MNGQVQGQAGHDQSAGETVQNPVVDSDNEKDRGKEDQIQAGERVPAPKSMAMRVARRGFSK